MIDAGYPIAWGVGSHGPGDNVFAYFVDQFGTSSNTRSMF